MSADGQVTEGEVITSSSYQKVRRLDNGGIVGFAGNAYNDDAFAGWLERGATGEVPKGLDEELCCLVLSPDGTLTTYDEHGRCFHERAPYAMGSGRKFALAAMDLGKSPEEAVVYASSRDIFSGGVITTLHLAPSELRAVA